MDRLLRNAPAWAEGSYRILHIMSFDSPWRWTDGQLAGFKEGLGLPKAEFKVFQMDVKRHSSPEAKERKGAEARALTEAWKPDLVYLSDDDAQTHVTRHYVHKALPFVFSGVNKTPESHGLEGAANVTGVLEQEHFVESVRLPQQLAPKVKRLAVITDSGAHWGPVMARIRASMARLQLLTSRFNALLDQLARREKELIVAKEGAETANRAKSDFLAVMSHEIRTPIIAVTAHAAASDRQACLEAGCDDYLSKPFDRDGLLTAIRRALNPRQ